MTPPDSGRPAQSPLPVPEPKRPTRIDWARAIALLAEGHSTGAVAQELGCTRQQVWNVLRRSHALTDALYDSEREIGTNANLRLRGLRPKLADALAGELDKGNVRVMLWLAEHLHVADPHRSRGTNFHAGDESLDAKSFAALTRSIDALFPPNTVDARLESKASDLTVNSHA